MSFSVIPTLVLSPVLRPFGNQRSCSSRASPRTPQDNQLLCDVFLALTTLGQLRGRRVFCEFSQMTFRLSEKVLKNSPSSVVDMLGRGEGRNLFPCLPPNTDLLQRTLDCARTSDLLKRWKPEPPPMGLGRRLWIRQTSLQRVTPPSNRKLTNRKARKETLAIP